MLITLNHNLSPRFGERDIAPYHHHLNNFWISRAIVLVTLSNLRQNITKWLIKQHSGKQ